MARLSVEHYRANANMTPEHVRKTGRLRDIFKSRSSAGPSTPDAAMKSPANPNPRSFPTSPTSPLVKPGFETVGLLPSERVSLVDVRSQLEENGAKGIVEALEQHDVELTSIGTLRTVDAGLRASSAANIDEGPRRINGVHEANKVKVIAEAFENALSKHHVKQAASDMQAKQGESSGLQWPAEHTSRMVRRTSLDELLATSQNDTFVTEYDDHMFSGSRGDDQVPKHEKLQNRMNASEGSLGAVGNDTVSITKPQTNNQGELQCQYDDVIQDSRKCPRQVHDLVFILLPKLVQGSGRMFSGTLDRELSSHVGNEPFNGGSDGHSDNHIRDKSPGENKPSARDESLSQSARELIASEIARAFKEHNRQHAIYVEKPHSPPIHMSLRMDMNIPKRRDTLTNPSVKIHRTKMFGGQKSIANITITSLSGAFVLQLLVVFYYVELVLRVLIHGPASMSISLLMCSLVVIAYAASMAQFGNDGAGSDLLLTPLKYVRDLAMENAHQGVRVVVEILMGMLVDALRGLLGEEMVMKQVQDASLT